MGKQPNPIDHLTGKQRKALEEAVLCAARQGKALSDAEVDEIAHQLLRLNNPARGINYCL
ncbi:hypothetical protein [Conchiformibius steedae]|uniref:hypothetical protein n=1 Tax=Conchiformibius steedae TaxID=153493 RepID=UPI0026EA2486|nr:hypothetical protein [Conchiformibius steedae]